jgi:hypothetical protein
MTDLVQIKFAVEPYSCHVQLFGSGKPIGSERFVVSSVEQGPSPNSDYDLRGTPVLPLDAVVGLEVRDETVQDERIIDGLEMDVVSHDVKKFFGLLLKKNGYVLEQLYSRKSKWFGRRSHGFCMRRLTKWRSLRILPREFRWWPRDFRGGTEITWSFVPAIIRRMCTRGCTLNGWES